MPADLITPVNGVITYIYFGENTELALRAANKAKLSEELALQSANNAKLSEELAENFATAVAGAAAVAETFDPASTADIDNEYASDPQGCKGRAIQTDGTLSASNSRFDKSLIRKLLSGSLDFVSPLNKFLGSITRGIGPGVGQITDVGRTLAQEVRSDGTTDLPLPHASRWAGSRLAVEEGYLLESRLRPNGRREIWANNLATAVSKKLSAEALSSYLDPHIIPASPTSPVAMCACIKQRASSAKLVALPLDGSGVEVALQPSPSIFFHGDSFLNNNLGSMIVGGMTNKRPFRVVNSGGGWLTAAVARLGGGIVPLAQAGSSPTTGGGARCNPDGTLNASGEYYIYPGLPQYWDWTYVHIEGGLEDLAASSDLATALAPVLARYHQLKTILTPAVRRILFTQSGIDSKSTPAQVSVKLACDALIAAEFPAEWVPTYDYMRATGTGTTVGSGGGQVWPADTYGVGDTLHPAATLNGSAVKTGVQLFSEPIAAALNSRGW